MVLQLAAAFIGTCAFALLFAAPTKDYLVCGAIGMVGWLVFLLGKQCGLSENIAVFLAACTVVLAVRIAAVRRKTPATVYLICGIIPLVPGGGIYRTAFNLVVGNGSLAARYAVSSVWCAVAIVFGISVIMAIPENLFHPDRWKRRIS